MNINRIYDAAQGKPGIMSLRATIFQQRIMFTKVSVVAVVVAASINGNVVGFVGDAGGAIPAIPFGNAGDRIALLHLLGLD